MIERDMSQLPSIKEPQIEPNGHAYLVLQDHGLKGGGWGPGIVWIGGLGMKGPILYTGTDQTTIELLGEAADRIHHATGKPTKLVKFTEMEEVQSWG